MRALKGRVVATVAVAALGTTLVAVDRLDVTGAGFSGTSGNASNTLQMSGACTPSSAIKYANGTISSGTTWVNPTNIVSSNDVYATRATARRVAETTSWQVSGFSAEIPSSGASLTSVKIEWEIKFSTANLSTEHGAGLSTSGGTVLYATSTQTANPSTDTVYSNTTGSSTVADMRAATLLITTRLYRDDSSAQTASLDMLRVTANWC